MEDKRKGKKKSTLEKQEMARLYEEKYSTTEIAKLANVTPRYVRTVLNELNVVMRPHGHWKRKYTFNEDYFKVWSNNMAYILGFFVADGTIARNGQFVSIAQKESDILEDIKKEIGTNQPLYQNKHTGVYLLYINSKILKYDLINIHGIMPNKSNTITFPYVPEEHLSHFIRGYFDGDGNTLKDRFNVSFVGGSEVFMYQLYNLFKELNFNTKFKKINNYFRVFITGKESVYRFANWIYQDKNLHLTTKLETFNTFFDLKKLDIIKEKKSVYIVNNKKIARL